MIQSDLKCSRASSAFERIVRSLLSIFNPPALFPLRQAPAPSRVLLTKQQHNSDVGSALHWVIHGVRGVPTRRTNLGGSLHGGLLHLRLQKSLKYDVLDKI